MPMIYMRDLPDDGHESRETLDDVVIERKGRWSVFFRCDDAIFSVSAVDVHWLRSSPGHVDAKAKATRARIRCDEPAQ